jgi:FlaA1/EpsC-like NDP-sugar epimerase
MALALIDWAIWVSAFLLFTALRYTDWWNPAPWGAAFAVGVAAGGLFVALCAWLRLYSGRHLPGSLDEASLVALCGGFVGLLTSVVLTVGREIRSLALSVPLAAAAASVLACLAVRVAYRRLKERSHRGSGGSRAVVVGAGAAGSRLVRDLHLEPNRPYDPVAFVDDDPGKRHFRVGYTRVLGTVGDLERIIRSEDIESVLVAAPSAGPDLVKRVNDIAEKAGVTTKVLPTLAELAGQEPGFRDLRDLELSDFLGRRQVQTDLTQVSHYLTGRRVLVTGAGGSIGSELCRQIAQFGPSSLMMLDRDESALHALQLSLDGRGQLDTRDLILADIRDVGAVREVFAERRPEVVFHAAALKHLSMLQMYPEEARKTNVVGTANVVAAAVAAGVAVFINISTDKAADPTSVLGWSKRLAERITAHSASSGRYVSVRFGNVLGSRGSVLTAFAEQIRTGGPITVTDPEVTRYFMTIAEAVQLVLQAGAIGRSGDVLILDMGTPVRIMDLAQQFMSISGRHVPVAVTGLRPGEKLHEVLCSDSEDLLPTHHPAITCAPVPAMDPRAAAAAPVTFTPRRAEDVTRAQQPATADGNVPVEGLQPVSPSPQAHGGAADRDSRKAR